MDGTLLERMIHCESFGTMLEYSFVLLGLVILDLVDSLDPFREGTPMAITGMRDLLNGLRESRNVSKPNSICTRQP